jgi:DNA-binding response OmpR family regulator
MPKILVIDDDTDIVDVCRLVLEKEGYEVASASNREAGMKAVEKEKPDLLILDVMMENPDDGIVMARDLRSKGFKAPILMLTSLGKVTGMQYGRDDDLVPVDEFFEKPIESAVLISKAKELLGK